MLLSPLPPSHSLRSGRLLPAFLNPLSAAAAAAITTFSCFSARPFFHAPLRLCCLAECGDPTYSLLTEKPWAASSSGRVKAPTAPWMKEPLLLPAEDVLDFSRTRRKKRIGKPRSGSLTEKVRGGRSRQAMKKIVQSIARLGEEAHVDEEDEECEEQGAVAEMLELPLERVLDSGKRGPETLKGEMPWVGAEKPMVFPRPKKKRVVTAAQLVLPQAELTRLRVEARKMTKWVKAKKAGVTEDVVDEVRATWRRSELAMVKFVEPLCRNMDRAREIVEVRRDRN